MPDGTIINGYPPKTTTGNTQSAQATQNTQKASKPKEKVTAYFTDATGKVIGSSKITKGTDIAKNQFPAEVKDCNGKKFDHWDYDGHVLLEDTIVRAIFK